MSEDAGGSSKLAGAAARPGGPLDPRRNVFRPDLASKTLYGKISAPRYVQGTPAQVSRSAVPLRNRPTSSQGFATEALYGEMVNVFEERDGWAWVQLARDKYVGYVPIGTLSQQTFAPTHRVRALGTFMHPVADIKSPPLMHLSMNAEVRVVRSDDRFSEIEGGGFVITRHLVELGRYANDYVEIAERFIGTPYLWGGRTRLGLDCSGLVQVSLQAAGFSSPRDTDMQQAELGASVPLDEVRDGLQRGDLVFWKGHVGMMIDSVTLIHANAHYMAVTVETLPEAMERIAKASGPTTAIRRLPGLCS